MGRMPKPRMPKQRIPPRKKLPKPRLPPVKKIPKPKGLIPMSARNVKRPNISGWTKKSKKKSVSGWVK